MRVCLVIDARAVGADGSEVLMMVDGADDDAPDGDALALALVEATDCLRLSMQESRISATTVVLLHS